MFDMLYVYIYIGSIGQGNQVRGLVRGQWDRALTLGAINRSSVSIKRP